MCSRCSLAVGCPGSRMFLTCAPPSSNPVSPSSMYSSHSAHCHILVVFASLIELWSYGFSSRGPVFHTHSSCRQKVGLLQSNVTRLLCSLPCATLVNASTSVGVYVTGAVTVHEQIKHVHIPFLSEHIDFSYFFLFMMHGSSDRSQLG